MIYNIKITTFRPLDLIGQNDHNLSCIWVFGIDCNDPKTLDDVDSIQHLQIGDHSYYSYRDMDGMYYVRTRDGFFTSKDFLSVISVINDYCLN